MYTTHEDEDSINITVFSYISVTTSDDIMANFTTFNESAMEGKLEQICREITLQKTLGCITIIILLLSYR